MNIATLTTFAASRVGGAGAAVAVTGTASVRDLGPTSQSTTSAAPVQVVRLDPVVVTISKARFEEVRLEETAVARAADAPKVKRG